jgi:hypothetical protein
MKHEEEQERMRAKAEAFLADYLALCAKHGVHLHASEWLSLMPGVHKDPPQLGEYYFGGGIALLSDDFG